MSRYDFAAQRLYVDAPLGQGARIALSRELANYLLNVLRLGAGASVNIFNGHDGEWRAELADTGRKSASLDVVEALRAQEAGPDLDYHFAPLKHARLDYMVQKAVEMGAARLLSRLLRDESGTASIEFIIVFAGLAGAAVAAAMALGPAVHGYADRLVNITQQANTVLITLQNTSAPSGP